MDPFNARMFRRACSIDSFRRDSKDGGKLSGTVIGEGSIQTDATSRTRSRFRSGGSKTLFRDEQTDDDRVTD